jgi:hypothetical protein
MAVRSGGAMGLYLRLDQVEGWCAAIVVLSFHIATLPAVSPLAFCKSCLLLLFLIVQLSCEE